MYVGELRPKTAKNGKILRGRMGKKAAQRCRWTAWRYIIKQTNTIILYSLLGLLVL